MAFDSPCAIERRLLAHLIVIATRVRGTLPSACNGRAIYPLHCTDLSIGRADPPEADGVTLERLLLRDYPATAPGEVQRHSGARQEHLLVTGLALFMQRGDLRLEPGVLISTEK